MLQRQELLFLVSGRGWEQGWGCAGAGVLTGADNLLKPGGEAKVGV